MPKIYYKQNILILNKEIILNKERISILDFSFSLNSYSWVIGPGNEKEPLLNSAYVIYQISLSFSATTVQILIIL